MSVTTPRAALVVALVAVVVAGPVVGTAAAAPPEPPAAYHGQVTVNGDPAPAGLTVAAHFHGETTDTLETTSDGAFGGPGAFDGKLKVPGNASTDGDSVSFTVNGVDADTTVSWSSGANEQVTLNVEDSTAPDAAVSNPVSAPVPAGTTVTLDASGSTDALGVDAYAWSLPDGSTASGPTAAYTFEDAGEHTVAVTVTDIAGNTATAETTVTVEAADTGNDGGGSGGSDDGPSTQPDDSTTNESAANESEASAGDVSLAVDANETTISVTNASANATTRIDIPESNATSTENASLTGLNVSTTTGANVSLSVSVSDRAPAENGSAADSGGGDALSYISVEHDVPDEEIGTVDFRFTVSESRMADRGTDADRVVLYRNHDDAWQRLDTRHVGTADGTATFVATSPGLSVFAVRSGQPDISVTDAALDATNVTVGEAASVAVTVTNDGSGAGNATLALTANGDAVTTRTVSVDADATTNVTLAFTPESAGEYDVAVNGTDAGTLTASAPATTTTESPSTDDAGNAVGGDAPREQSGFDLSTVAVTALVAVLVVALFALARRRV